MALDIVTQHHHAHYIVIMSSRRVHEYVTAPLVSPHNPRDQICLSDILFLDFVGDTTHAYKIAAMSADEAPETASAPPTALQLPRLTPASAAAADRSNSSMASRLHLLLIRILTWPLQLGEYVFGKPMQRIRSLLGKRAKAYSAGECVAAGAPVIAARQKRWMSDPPPLTGPLSSALPFLLGKTSMFTAQREPVILGRGTVV